MRVEGVRVMRVCGGVGVWRVCASGESGAVMGAWSRVHLCWV
jgi:hypothetical protein